MNFNKNNQVNVVKRQQKEEMITDFITDFIASLTAPPSEQSKNLAVAHGSELTTPISVLCLARSPASPVAKALAGMNDTLIAAGISVRVIFSQLCQGADSMAWMQFDDDSEFSRSIRLVTRTELHDAHELLVLDAQTSWIGDCLRREPTKNDAYETYARRCAASAGSAATSFERVWQICKPVHIRQGSDAERQFTAQLCGGGASVVDPSMFDELGEDNGPFSATRH